jgi:hypothetical protein
MMETDEQTRGDYACAIGTVVLAFGDLEAEILSLIERLGSKLTRQQIEEASFGNRLKEIVRLAELQGETARSRLLSMCIRARELADERDSFAHGHLWRDADGTHRLRSFLRRPGLTHDDRTPQEIANVSLRIKALEDELMVLATSIPSPRDEDAEAAIRRLEHGCNTEAENPQKT